MLFKGYTWDAKELFGVSLWRFLKRMHAVAGRDNWHRETHEWPTYLRRYAVKFHGHERREKRVRRLTADEVSNLQRFGIGLRAA